MPPREVQEHALGAIRSPKDPRDYPLSQLIAAVGPEATFPSSWLEANTPPVTNQGNTPQCTAYSNGYDQNHIDRPEGGRFVDFNEPRFYQLIGGTDHGAAIRWALDRRRNFGYPVTGLGDSSQASHRIAAYYAVPLTVESIKTALMIVPNNGGVVIATTWFHSWFRTLASGKLPAPDYSVGGHAIWVRGWSDTLRAFRLRNSWGPYWGLSGDCYLPYAYLKHLWEAWRTVDR